MDFLINFPSLIFLIFTSPDAPDSTQKEEQKQEIQVEEQKTEQEQKDNTTFYFVPG